MEIGNVNFKVNNNDFVKKHEISPAEVSENRIDKSLYNTPGMNVYFRGGYWNGISSVESICVNMLNRLKEVGGQKFNKSDINDIMGYLKRVKSPTEKSNIISDIFDYESWNGMNLLEEMDKVTFKRLVKSMVGKSEDERAALMEFMENELGNSCQPFEAFANLTEGANKKLTEILLDIGKLNGRLLNESNEVRATVINNLYDTVRVPIYLHDDLYKGGAEACKKEAVKLLQDDFKWYEKISEQQYKDTDVKDEILSIVKKILDYTNNI